MRKPRDKIIKYTRGNKKHRYILFLGRVNLNINLLSIKENIVLASNAKKAHRLAKRIEEMAVWLEEQK